MISIKKPLEGKKILCKKCKTKKYYPIDSDPKTDGIIACHKKDCTGLKKYCIKE